MIKRMGIKYQLRLTTLIPISLVAILFALFYNGQFSYVLSKHTSRLGEAYIKQLTPTAQFALIHHDIKTLQGLVNASSINTEIHSIAFYDKNGNLIAYRGGNYPLTKKFPTLKKTDEFKETFDRKNETILFYAPITIAGFNLYSDEKSHNKTNQLLGWLTLEIDTQSTLIKKYQMYIITIFITLFGLLIALTIHYLLSKRIYEPIDKLKYSMKQILSNEFETEIIHRSGGELGIIEQGCLHLQKNYLDAKDDIESHVETATEDLQQSLELLEEKNIQLLMEKKKIEEKNRQKSEFIANMSHEIRTPMNAVIGFTNVLLETSLDTLQFDYVKTIKSSANDLLNIINDILDYSKIDAGHLNLDCIPIDFRACIDEVLALVSPLANKKHIDLIPSTDKEVPHTVLGDPIRIKQILMNLINNAVKFTDQGFVLIQTKVENETSQHYTLSISVKDTGIGISKEDQTKLFQAFHQADTTITRRYGGSGLGLVICQKLAESMNGAITLNSEVGKGSIFTIKLKLEKYPAYEAEKNQIHRHSNLKVICFEENPVQLEALCNGLNVFDVNIIKVTHMNKLQTTLSKHMDANIAFININPGFELQIYEIMKAFKIPYVLISKQVVHDYQQYGAIAHLIKPISIQKIRDVLEFEDTPIKTNYNQPHSIKLREQLKKLNLKILVAEDNPVNRMLLNSQLSATRAEITLVENGEEAFKKAMNYRYDVILLDLQMPIMSGLDAAKDIKKQSIINKTTPIIIITANSQDLKADKLRKLGIDICLPKPIDEQQLLMNIHNLVRKNKEAPIDWDLCVQKVSGNKNLAEDYLACFVKELKINKQDFITLMKDEDTVAIEKAAHKLLGACCYCGVPKLQQQAKNLELIAQKNKNFKKINHECNELIRLIDEVIVDYESSYTQNE